MSCKIWSYLISKLFRIAGNVLIKTCLAVLLLHADKKTEFFKTCFKKFTQTLFFVVNQGGKAPFVTFLELTSSIEIGLNFLNKVTH